MAAKKAKKKVSKKTSKKKARRSRATRRGEGVPPDTVRGERKEGWPKTKREYDFCLAYMQCWKGTEAARRAGYSKTYADKQSHTLVRRLQPFIDHLMERNESNSLITIERTREEMACLAFANPKDFFVQDVDGRIRAKRIDELTRAEAAAIKSFSVKQTKSGTEYHYELSDKRASLETLGKHLGMFSERVMLYLLGGEKKPRKDLRKVPTETLEEVEQKLMDAVEKSDGDVVDGEYTEVGER